MACRMSSNLWDKNHIHQNIRDLEPADAEGSLFSCTEIGLLIKAEDAESKGLLAR